MWLGQGGARSLELKQVFNMVGRDSSIWAILCSLPGGMLAESWINMGCKDHKPWLNLLHHTMPTPIFVF